MSVDIKYRPWGKVLSEFCRSEEYMNIIRGPLGSGKTKACVFKILDIANRQTVDANGIRKTKWGALRNTYGELKTTTIKEVQEVLPPLIGKIVMGQPPQAEIRYALPDGTRVECDIDFLALDRDEDIRKLRGAQWTGVWFNELRFMPMSVVREALSRTGRFPYHFGFSRWKGGIADTNPWNQGHPLADLEAQFARGELPGWRFFTQPPGVLRGPDGGWIVNPEAENMRALGPVYYSRQLAGAPEDWIRVNLANEIGLSFDGRAVHPEFSDAVHTAKSELVPTAGLVRVGLDFGLSPAAAFAQRQANGQWIVFDEIVTDSMGATRLSEELKRVCSNWRARVPGLEFHFVGDPSGDNRSQTDERSVFDVLRVNGVSAVAASTNDTAIRREALTRPLTRMIEGGKPGIIFSPRCTTIRTGLAGAWHYKRVKVAGVERFKDKPDKDAFSHVCEALEYALMDAGEHAVVNARQAIARPTRPVAMRTDWNPFNL
jgi:hypothetical protein